VLSVTQLPILKWQARDPAVETLSVKSTTDWKTIQKSFPFYRGILWDTAGTSTLILASIDSLTLHTRAKHELLRAVKALAFETAQKLHTRLHLGGVPYLRHEVAQLVPGSLSFSR
jgi:uncharacterized protein